MAIGYSASVTTGSASIHIKSDASLAYFNGCIPSTITRGRDWAWPFVKKSSKGKRAVLASTQNRGRDRRSFFYYQANNRRPTYGQQTDSHLTDRRQRRGRPDHSGTTERD